MFLGRQLNFGAACIISCGQRQVNQHILRWLLENVILHHQVKMEVWDGGGSSATAGRLIRGVLSNQEVGGLAPKFASQILVEAPNFASKSIGNKYPKFCYLNFRYDTKITFASCHDRTSQVFPFKFCLQT